MAAAALAAGISVPGAAQAAGADGWDAASAAYQRGKASDLRPGNSIEIAYCTGYWQALVDAGEDGTVPTAVIARIESGLGGEYIDEIFESWAFMLDGSSEARAASDQAAADASELLVRAAAGDFTDALDYFEMLGACQLPPLAR